MGECDCQGESGMTFLLRAGGIVTYRTRFTTVSMTGSFACVCCPFHEPQFLKGSYTGKFRKIKVTN